MSAAPNMANRRSFRLARQVRVPMAANGDLALRRWSRVPQRQPVQPEPIFESSVAIGRATRQDPGPPCCSPKPKGPGEARPDLFLPLLTAPTETERNVKRDRVRPSSNTTDQGARGEDVIEPMLTELAIHQKFRDRADWPAVRAFEDQARG